MEEQIERPGAVAVRSRDDDPPIFAGVWNDLYGSPAGPPAAKRARVSTKAKAQGADGK